MNTVISTIVNPMKTGPAISLVTEPKDKLPVDLAAVERNLKDFQQDTVDYVFRRMYLDKDPALRFLIADEVGLGKTLVARGLIARAVEHLWDKVKQIDIIYICSNADIARQNIARLNVTGQKNVTLTSRITLLPIERQGQDKNNRINFISFTPKTSFDLKSSMGRAEERALLFLLLKKAWKFRENDSILNVLEGQKGRARFRELVKKMDEDRKIDESISKRFTTLLEDRESDENNTKDTLKLRFEKLRKKIGKASSYQAVSKEQGRLRNQLIGDLRGLLAKACLEELEPDLIILDEFQRFKHLINSQSKSDESELAQALFAYQAQDNCDIKARVLLLSATPYKMYTLEDEGGDENHYQDFLSTLQFLLSSQKLPSQKAENLEKLITQYRKELLQLPNRVLSEVIDNTTKNGKGPLFIAKSNLEKELSKVMVRTERLGVSEDRNGMLVEIHSPNTKLCPNDLNSYLLLQDVAEVIDHHDTLEYWKSVPYALNFMEDYQLKKNFNESLKDPLKNTLLARAVNTYQESLLNQTEIKQYCELDPGNARLRGLLVDTVDQGVWKLLWIPPSMPYYQLSGPYANPETTRFTKRLIFSSWRVVPKAIANLISYEVERRMMGSFEENPENTPDARKKRRPLLRFAKGADGRETGMPVLGLLYPCVTLALECDPLKFGLDYSKSHDSKLPEYEATLSIVEDRVRQLLKKLGVSSDKATADKKGKGGPPDEAWYWAAPILLDLVYYRETTEEWFNDTNLAKTWAGEFNPDEDEDEGKEELTNWSEHLERAKALLKTGKKKLGRPPEDLAQVVAKLAIAGPGTLALRALARLSKSGLKLNATSKLRSSAANLGWGFRKLFNQPEVLAMLRGVSGESETEKSYWERVLDYAGQGCLQAVLDEYVHFLRESLGLVDADFLATAEEITKTVRKALSLRTSSLNVEEITTQSDPARSGERIIPNSTTFRMRNHFAMRFGDQPQEESDKNFTRGDLVREAFNSPFWPFILATTSIGQEGLDFHPYCHAVVHWNLPSNPVDLEQREGRVHRYKGHAVRKNLATKYGFKVLKDAKGDPWQKLFDQAKRDRPKNENDLTPFWIFQCEGGAQIERHVPSLPLSRDRNQLEVLLRSLTVYRMVFGQNRQEDLVNYLLANLPEEEVEKIRKQLVINLEPPRKFRKRILHKQNNV